MADKNQTDKVVEGEIISGKSFKERAEGYQKDLQAISKKWNCQIVVVPQFRARDDGTFSVVIQSSIGELPKEN